MDFYEFINWVDERINDGALSLWELDECNNVIHDVMNRPADEWESRWQTHKDPITRHIIRKVNTRVYDMICT